MVRRFSVDSDPAAANARVPSGKVARRPRIAWRIGLMIAALTIGLLTLRIVQPGATGLIESSPKQGEAVKGEAVMVSLRFDEPVDHEDSKLTLKSSKGDRDLKPSLAAGAKYLVGTAGRLEPGEYELVWEAHLANGVTRTGTISFTVQKQSGQ